MSTFKRLFNVGKGKVKSAQKDLGDAVSTGTDKPGEWLDKARHGAADAAEAVADVIRPEDRDEPEHSERSPREAATAERTVRASRPADDEVEVEDAEEVAEKISKAKKSPKKRTL